METITKDILKDELDAGRGPAVELLYNRYGAMLFSYVLQFIPDKPEAEALLVNIFARLAPQLQEAFDSSLSVYCWLQIESRKIVLAYLGEKVNGQQGAVQPLPGGFDKRYYSRLLTEASPEHQWIFRELFIHGRDKEELATSTGKGLAYVSRILRDCLFMIRKNLG